jgi:hypothetical protein
MISVETALNSGYMEQANLEPLSMTTPHDVGTSQALQESRVVEVDGVFVGAAVALQGGAGWRFVSADVRVSGLDGASAPSVAEARRMARQALFAARAA